MLFKIVANILNRKTIKSLDVYPRQHVFPPIQYLILCKDHQLYMQPHFIYSLSQKHFQRLREREREGGERERAREMSSGQSPDWLPAGWNIRSKSNDYGKKIKVKFSQISSLSYLICQNQANSLCSINFS